MANTSKKNNSPQGELFWYFLGLPAQVQACYIKEEIKI